MWGRCYEVKEMPGLGVKKQEHTGHIKGKIWIDEVGLDFVEVKIISMCLSYRIIILGNKRL